MRRFVVATLLALSLMLSGCASTRHSVVDATQTGSARDDSRAIASRLKMGSPLRKRVKVERARISEVSYPPYVLAAPTDGYRITFMLDELPRLQIVMQAESLQKLETADWVAASPGAGLTDVDVLRMLRAYTDGTGKTRTVGLIRLRDYAPRSVARVGMKEFDRDHCFVVAERFVDLQSPEKARGALWVVYEDDSTYKPISLGRYRDVIAGE